MSGACGPDDACRDLVMLPGWSFSPQIFAKLVSFLSPAYRVTLLPLPAGKTLVEMATHALAAAPQQAVWFGWSLGGMVAAQAALLAPARVTGLLTLATNLSFVAREQWPQAMETTTFDLFSLGLAEDAAATLKRFDALQCQGSARAVMREEWRALQQWRAEAEAPCIATAAVNTGAKKTGLCEDAAPVARAKITAPDAEALRDGLCVLRNADLRSAITTLACSSTWLYAEQDALVPAAVANAVRRVMPESRVVVLAGASHLAFFSAAESVAEHLNFMITESA